MLRTGINTYDKIDLDGVKARTRRVRTGGRVGRLRI